MDDSNDNEEEDKRKSKRAEAIAKAKEELWEKQQSKGKDNKEKERKELQKRANKHAPTEVTSKRPMSRKREVVEVDKIRSRDPRFLSLSGNFSQDLYEKSFSFLKGSLSKEVADAKDQLKTAQLNIRRARSLPGQSEDKTYLIEEHQAEVDRLTHEIQRMSSQAKTSQKKDIEKEALRKIKKEERDKRGEGKKAYYLKDCEFTIPFTNTHLSQIQLRNVNALKKLKRKSYVHKEVTKRSRNLKNANVNVTKAKKRNPSHGQRPVVVIVLEQNGERLRFVLYYRHISCKYYLLIP